MHGSTSGSKPQFLTCFHLVCREAQHRHGKVVPAPAMQLPTPLAHLPAKQARKRQHRKAVVCTECLEVSNRIHAHCKDIMNTTHKFLSGQCILCDVIFQVVSIVSLLACHCMCFLSKSMQLQCTSKSMQLHCNSNHRV